MLARTAFLTLAASVVTAYALVGVPSSGSAATLSIGLPPDCILYCWDEPPYCGPDEHDAWWVETGSAKYGNGYHSVSNPCWVDDCAEEHPSCTPDGGELLAIQAEAIRRALERRDLAGFESAVANASGNRAISINNERHAVQLLDCDGRVRAHFPIPESLRSVTE